MAKGKELEVGGEHVHTKRYALVAFAKDEKGRSARTDRRARDPSTTVLTRPDAARTEAAEPLAEILSSGRERAATILQDHRVFSDRA